MSDLSTNYANAAGNSYSQMGMNTGNSMLARGSAYGNALGSAANQAGRWYQSQQSNPYGMPNNDGSGNMPWGEGPGW
jgi:hypothetical protein